MRIRTIKPDFWTNPRMMKQSDETKLLALALLNFADDRGYFYADSDVVCGSLFPKKESGAIEKSMRILADMGYIDVRDHPSHGPIGRIHAWEKHQRVNRPQESKIADLFDSLNVHGSISDQSVNNHGTISDQSVIVQSEVSHPCAEGKEQGKEQGTGKGREGSAEGRGSIPDPPDPASDPLDPRPRTSSSKKSKKARRGYVSQSPPSLDEILAYMQDYSPGTPRATAEAFRDYFQGNGWRTGKNPLVDWEAAARRWIRREPEFQLTGGRSQSDSDWESALGLKGGAK